ncbi:hypothetical protein [uncultured Desulfobacter sp.]|uniref:hypothetical protein n=1 Tax=uncultured Desulfobacter sp. TaxID=240139 RepID=UPI0029F4F6E7|nr:hypothetical protein [uncultured Desulfobacter sp.]
MVALLKKHNIRWLAPQPMWNNHTRGILGTLDPAFVRPTILRFNSDLFMDELISLMAHQPDSLGEWEARPETWRRPMATPPAAANLQVIAPISNRSRQIARDTLPSPSFIGDISSGSSSEEEPPLPLKLYQPAHQRYYLITAALVCRQRGLPDRFVNHGNQEKVSFVIRRWIADDTTKAGPSKPDGINTHEYAYVKTANGYVWKRLNLNEYKVIQQQEERLPLFPVNYKSRPNTRRLLAGMIPVGNREAYLSAEKEPDNNTDSGNLDTAQTSSDPRRLLFEAQVTAPWKALVEQAHTLELQLLPDPPNPTPSEGEKVTAKNNFASRITSIREQIQTGSWYVLLDFTLFLKKHLKAVWQNLIGDSSAPTLSIAENKLATAIRSVTIPPELASDLYNALDEDVQDFYEIKINLVDALFDILNYASGLEDAQISFNAKQSTDPEDNKWPDFLFPLANPAVSIDAGTAEIEENVNLAVPSPTTDEDVSDFSGIDVKLSHIDELANLVEACLEEEPDQLFAELEVPNMSWDNRDAWFVIRCVYERPNCGPLNPPAISEPTLPFQMASFFDPDAPARSILIPMPVDVSPAGLRKFKKNATLMMSDMLCGKIKSIRKITLADLVLSVLPWPFHKDLPNMGDTGPCKKGISNNFGMFCSFSIPIVTLCALILLIIIVQLFDFIFRWIPYLFICFPIPGFGGKKD